MVWPSVKGLECKVLNIPEIDIVCTFPLFLKLLNRNWYHLGNIWIGIIIPVCWLICSVYVILYDVLHWCDVICTYTTWSRGHFVAQALSYKLSVVEVWVQIQGSSYGICSRQVTLQWVFLEALCVSHASFHSTIFSCNQDLLQQGCVRSYKQGTLVTSLLLLLHHKCCGRSFNDGVLRAVFSVIRLLCCHHPQGAMMMEAAGSSWVLHFNTCCHIAGDSSVRSHHFENPETDGRERSCQGPFW